MQKIKLIPTKNPVPKPEGGLVEKEGIELELPISPYYQRRLKSGELEIEKEIAKPVTKPKSKE